MKRLLLGLMALWLCLESKAQVSATDIAPLRLALTTDSLHARQKAEELLKKDRKNPDLAAAIGSEFLRRGRIEDAEFFYDKGYHMKRISPTIINLAGDIALSKNDQQKAEYYYGRAMYFDRRHPDAYYKYARMYAKKDAEKAVEKLQTLRIYHPGPQIDMRIAEIYYESNRFADAARTYASLPIDSLGKTELTNYALSYYFMQQFDSALAVGEEGHKRFPRHPAFNRMILYCNTELKHYDEAIAGATDLFQHSDNAELQYLDYIYDGYALNGLGRYDEAIAQFNRVLELNKDRKDVVKAIADAYEIIGDYDRAISYYRQYVDKLEGDERTPYEEYHIGQLYYQKGTDERQTKELTSAKTEALRQADAQFAKVERMRPDSYLGPYWRARTQMALDPQTEKGLAKPYYMKVIEIMTGNGEQSAQLTESYKYLAYYYYLKKDKREAMKYVDKILDISPTDDYALRIANVLSAG